ncbi:MAG: DNA-binding protein, partial [Catenulispora sp.]|nr:DNA-binding protein [Catenulispora sp.]
MSAADNEDLALTPEKAARLLAAGAVLPPGTEVAGERAVSLTARTYRHPGLDDRIVVRLTPGELGAAEDAAAGFLGLTLDGEPAEVGLGLRQSLGFPEWVLAHHPEDGHQALALLPELERAAKQVRSRPKAALQTYQAIADRLAAALPHFLPTYFEQVGRTFLAEENVTYASQMFTKARRAESAHGLELDEDRLDEVFLEFALAGALPAKALVDYGKALSSRVPPVEALQRYTRLCSRRTAGGLTPSAQLATELRRLAKASGADAAAVERQYLAGLLTLPATLRAPEGWWKSHRAAIVELLRTDLDLRLALLNVMPDGDDANLPGLWLAILTEGGAIQALHDDAPDDAVFPDDGAAGWLRRFQSLRSGWRARNRMPELYSLVERCAGRLRSELTAAGETLTADGDLDLLDLVLTLGLPVA